MDQRHSLHRVSEGSWKFAQAVYMCFVDLEKPFHSRIMWEMFESMESECFFATGRMVPIRPEAWFTLPAVRQTCSQYILNSGCPLSPVLFIIFIDRISQVSQGPEGVWFRSHWFSSLLFTHDFFSSLDSWFATKCKAAVMRINTSKSEAMVFNRETLACRLRVWGEPKAQMEEFKYFGFCFIKEGLSVRFTGASVQQPQYCAHCISLSCWSRSWADFSCWLKWFPSTLWRADPSEIRWGALSPRRPAAPPNQQDPAEVAQASLSDTSLGKCSGPIPGSPPGDHILLQSPPGDPGKDSGHAGVTMPLGWHVNTLGNVR